MSCLWGEDKTTITIYCNSLVIKMNLNGVKRQL